MAYGIGYKQQKVVELGEIDKLTWGTLVNLYGFSKAQEELVKLVDLGLIEKPKLERPSFPVHSRCYVEAEWDAYYSTKIVWKHKGG